MQELNKIALKLQYALAAAGRPVSVNRRQFYSIVYKKLITKYTVRAESCQPGEKAAVLLETYSLADVVKLLAAELREVQDGK